MGRSLFFLRQGRKRNDQVLDLRERDRGRRRYLELLAAARIDMNGEMHRQWSLAFEVLLERRDEGIMPVQFTDIGADVFEQIEIAKEAPPLTFVQRCGVNKRKRSPRR